MKAVLTETDVKNAIHSLTTAGRKVTLAALHAAVGNRGSITTLVKLKAQLEKSSEEPETSEEAKEAFRLLWAAGLEAGQKINDDEIADLKATVAALTEENEALEARMIGLGAKLEEAQGQVSALVAQLGEATSERRTLQERNAEVTAEVERMAGQLRDAEKRNDHQQDQLNQANATVQALEAKLAHVDQAKPVSPAKPAGNAAKKAGKRVANNAGYTEEHARRFIEKDTTGKLPNM